MKFKDALWLGILAGLIGPSIGILLFYFFNFSSDNLLKFLSMSISKNLLSPLLSLCAIINLGIFYLFLYVNRYYAARGVILATLMYGLVIVVLKFVL